MPNHKETDDLQMSPLSPSFHPLLVGLSSFRMSHCLLSLALLFVCLSLFLLDCRTRRDDSPFVSFFPFGCPQPNGCHITCSRCIYSRFSPCVFTAAAACQHQGTRILGSDLHSRQLCFGVFLLSPPCLSLHWAETGKNRCCLSTSETPNAASNVAATEALTEQQQQQQQQLLLQQEQQQRHI